MSKEIENKSEPSRDRLSHSEPSLKPYFFARQGVWFVELLGYEIPWNPRTNIVEEIRLEIERHAFENYDPEPMREEM